MQHVLDQNLLAGAVGATGVDDDWLPDTSELQPEAMARQLHRTKWAFGLVSVTHLSARMSTGSLAGRFGEPGMCRWLRMSVRMADMARSMERVGRKGAVCVGFVQYNSTYMRTCVTESADAG